MQVSSRKSSTSHRPTSVKFSLQSPCASRLFTWTSYFGSHTAMLQFTSDCSEDVTFESFMSDDLPSCVVAPPHSKCWKYLTKNSKCEIFPHMYFDKMGNEWHLNAVSKPHTNQPFSTSCHARSACLYTQAWSSGQHPTISCPILTFSMLVNLGI